MERRTTPQTPPANPDETRRRLTSEMSDVESAIEMVSSGAASRITLSGLRFGDQVAARFQATAAARGIVLEPLPWPDDAGCDLIVRRNDA